MDTLECVRITSRFYVANEDGSFALVGWNDALDILFPGSVLSPHYSNVIFYKWNSKGVLVCLTVSYFKNIHISSTLPSVLPFLLFSSFSVLHFHSLPLLLCPLLSILFLFRLRSPLVLTIPLLPPL